MLSSVKNEGIEFLCWRPEGATFAVEFRRDVLEEVRRAVEEGFQKVGHGGIEHGGVLFGSVDDGTVRVAEWRKLNSEHARGPSFTLSDTDRSALEEMAAASEPKLAGLKAVGWWVSHSRSKVALKPHDIEIHDGIFPDAHQFVLVLKPARDAATGAGIFLRDSLGNLNADAPAAPFEITASAGALMGPKRATAASAAPEGLPVARPPAHRAEPRPEPNVPVARASEQPIEIPEPAFLRVPPPSKRRLPKIALIAGFAAALAAVAVYLPDVLESGSSSAALRVEEQRDQLFIRWEGNASNLRRADRGALEIHDGGPLQVIALDSDEVRGGTVTYVRRSTDVQVRLTIYRGGTAVMQEYTRYLGPPVNAPRAAIVPAGTEGERAQLAAENQRLSGALQQEVSRNVRLQESVQTLETRIRQEDARRANNP